MDRQYDRRNQRNREVNLVRMSSYDNRGSRRGRRRRKAKDSVMLLAISLFLMVSCIGGLYYVMRLEAQENITGIEADGTVDQQPGTVMGKVPERDEEARSEERRVGKECM